MRNFGRSMSRNLPGEHGPQRQEHDRHDADQVGADGHRAEAFDVIVGDGRGELGHLVDEAEAGDEQHRDGKHDDRRVAHRGRRRAAWSRAARRPDADAAVRSSLPSMQGIDVVDRHRHLLDPTAQPLHVGDQRQAALVRPLVARRRTTGTPA